MTWKSWPAGYNPLWLGHNTRVHLSALLHGAPAKVGVGELFEGEVTEAVDP